MAEDLVLAALEDAFLTPLVDLARQLTVERRGAGALAAMGAQESPAELAASLRRDADHATASRDGFLVVSPGWLEAVAATVEMFGAGWGAAVDFWDDPDWKSRPLPAGTAWEWKQMERRVEWALANFTAGEKAYLYRLLHDGDGLRRAACDESVRKEKAGCSS